MAKNLIPVLSPEGGLSRYLQEIRHFPMLDAEEEYILAKRWREGDDVASARREESPPLPPLLRPSRWTRPTS